MNVKEKKLSTSLRRPVFPLLLPVSAQFQPRTSKHELLFTAITASLGGCDAQKVSSGDKVIDEWKTPWYA